MAVCPCSDFYRFAKRSIDGHRLVEQGLSHDFSGEQLVDALHKKLACFIVTGNPNPNEEFHQAFLAAVRSKKEDLRKSGSAKALLEVSESEGEGEEEDGDLEKCVGCRKKV